MARAIELGLREQFITLKQQGYSLLAISQQLQLHYGTVCSLSSRLKRFGDLKVDYQHCGTKQPFSESLLVRAAHWLKKHHQQWGSPLIHLKLVERYGKQHTPAIRTLQRWFRKAGLTNKPPQQLCQPRIGQSTAPHNIWQVDAKENLTLLDGSGACYLTLTDEHSGAGLACLVFPPQAHLTGAGRGDKRKTP